MLLLVMPLVTLWIFLDLCFGVAAGLDTRTAGTSWRYEGLVAQGRWPSYMPNPNAIDAFVEDEVADAKFPAFGETWTRAKAKMRASFAEKWSAAPTW